MTYFRDRMNEALGALYDAAASVSGEVPIVTLAFDDARSATLFEQQIKRDFGADMALMGRRLGYYEWQNVRFSVVIR